MRILTVNAGSSSVRLAAFRAGAGAQPERVGALRLEHGELAAGEALGRAAAPLGAPPELVAHRVVHGGARFSAPCAIDAAVEAEIARLAPLAPLHNPAALEWLGAARARFPEAEQAAVFDTALFGALPEVARTYALPRELAARLGLRRYGFHGIAHQAMARRWAELHPELERGGRVVSLQLGAGCSVAALSGGRALDTSMGFSPLEGLVMATRAGDLDPGLLLYLLREGGFTPARLEALLAGESGLLGVSGASADMRALLGSSEPAARLAVELYCYRARKYVAAYLAVLGGADAILFGGGIGEHAPEVRSRILEGLQWAGIGLDRAANRAAVGAEAAIGAPGCRVAVQVIAVDEAQVIAEQALEALAAAPASLAR